MVITIIRKRDSCSYDTNHMTRQEQGGHGRMVHDVLKAGPLVMTMNNVRHKSIPSRGYLLSVKDTIRRADVKREFL